MNDHEAIGRESPEWRRLLMRRVRRLHGAAQLALVLIAIGYWFVQIVEGEIYRAQAENNRLRRLTIEAPRGLIYDRHGRPLVENVPSYYLLLDRSLSVELEATIDFAAAVVGQPGSQLATRAAGPGSALQPVRIAEDLTLEQVARLSVEQLEHPELEIAADHLRLYRHADRTAHLLGFLGEVTDDELARLDRRYRPGDLVGKKGIELLYEKRLRGRNGEQEVVVDSRGRRIEELDRVQAVPGRPLYLTVDLELQDEAARLLAGHEGAIVALDPRHGEVLALASSPAYDPNRFARRLRREQWRELVADPRKPLRNRAVQDHFPPGSVFKIVVALAALERGLIDPETTRVLCPGAVVLFGQRRRCWQPRGHGVVDFHRALRESCDVFFYRLGEQLDVDEIAACARLVGLGRRTGIDLDDERPGLVPTRRWSRETRGAAWYAGETISVAIGQGPLLVTPLQMAVVTAAVATGRQPVRPHLVRAGGPPPDPPPLPFDPAHLRLVREGLVSVVNDPGGTGRTARVAGLAVAGKTGTAQVVTQATWTTNEELAPQLRDHAWFVSWAPADDPRLVVVVLVEHGGAGSQAAAPLARAMYEKYFAAEREARR